MSWNGIKCFAGPLRKLIEYCKLPSSHTGLHQAPRVGADILAQTLKSAGIQLTTVSPQRRRRCIVRGISSSLSLLWAPALLIPETHTPNDAHDNNKNHAANCNNCVQPDRLPSVTAIGKFRDRDYGPVNFSNSSVWKQNEISSCIAGLPANSILRGYKRVQPERQADRGATV